MRRLETRVTNAIGKVRLDDFLAQWLSTILNRPMPRRISRQLIVAGTVYVNRHRANNASVALYPGAFIECYYDEKKVELWINGRAPVNNTGIREDQILFEDEWLIAISKPPGIPTQPTVDVNRTNVYQSLKDLLFKLSKGKQQYLGMHHRLDRDTSGVLIFTKKEEANRGIAESFANHQAKKIYQALSYRLPEANDQFSNTESTSIKTFIKKVSDSGAKGRFSSVKSGGDPAETFVKKQEVLKHSVYWLQAEPRTGRTHQIRVHLSEQGFPILGDEVYFPEGIRPLVKVPRLMLHSNLLQIEHPILKTELRIEAPLPQDFLTLMSELGQ